ncbi:MAG TPA: hypothetical protein VHE54_17730, partial [Puia sp.]|nr:hypothetical protein [Puia sp.]
QGNGSQPEIVDITNGSATNIPFTGFVAYGGHLNSHGAVFAGTSLNENFPGGWQNFFEWHDGSLDSLGRLADPVTNVFAGDYGTCTPFTPALLTYRNFATQTSQIVPTVSGLTAVSISPSGSVLGYGTAGPRTNEIAWHVYSFATESARVVVDDSSGTAYGEMLTDGVHVVYARVNAATNYSSIILGSSGNVFDTLSVFPPSVSGYYVTPTTLNGFFRINNGFTAYLNPGSQGVYQVWIRDSTGKKTQLTFFGTNYAGNAKVENLNGIGELTYLAPGLSGLPSQSTIPNRAIYIPAAGSVRIGAIHGRSYYTDSTWYVVVGRTVFRVNLAITPNKSDNFTVNVKPDSLYGFTTGSFAAHFEGSGLLSKVTFTKVPAHGKLALNGNVLFVPGNNSVLRASLQNLVYTPTVGFRGVDTVYWYGSGDFTSSTDTGMLLLNVNVISPPPSQPAISGLVAKYCSNGGNALFTMTNFPDTTGGAVKVTDSLDDQPLAIGSGASCSITLSGLSAGAHTVKITYTNTGGSTSLVQSFTVVAASTPTVGLSASYTTIPDTAAAVVVRADAVSGGGTLPQYTFALNRYFSPALYGPGTADSVAIDTATLAIGANTVYVRMQTSDSCYTAQYVIDSIVITRTVDTTGQGGNGGNDSTATTAVGPNPFSDQLNILGLVPSHVHTIQLLNGNGMEMVRVRVTGVNKTTIFAGTVPRGVYLMRIYDETAGKMIRRVKLLALGH